MEVPAEASRTQKSVAVERRELPLAAQRSPEPHWARVTLADGRLSGPPRRPRLTRRRLKGLARLPWLAQASVRGLVPVGVVTAAEAVAVVEREPVEGRVESDPSRCQQGEPRPYPSASRAGARAAERFEREESAVFREVSGA